MNEKKMVELRTSHKTIIMTTRYILENIEYKLTLNDLEFASGQNKYVITRLFKRTYGMTPVRWIWDLRTQYAYELLKNLSNIRIIDIAVCSGFNSQAHLSRLLKLKFKQTASEIRQIKNDQKTEAYTKNPIVFLNKAFQLVG